MRTVQNVRKPTVGPVTLCTTGLVLLTVYGATVLVHQESRSPSTKYSFSVVEMTPATRSATRPAADVLADDAPVLIRSRTPYSRRHPYWDKHGYFYHWSNRCPTKKDTYRYITMTRNQAEDAGHRACGFCWDLQKTMSRKKPE